MVGQDPGILRPKGGTKKFRANCRLVLDDGALVAIDRSGNQTRFQLDGSEDAPKEMVTYLYGEDFVFLDGRGRGVISSPYAMWDADEHTEFCDLAGIETSVTDESKPPPLRPDSVRLVEPTWLLRYIATTPFVFPAGVALALLGRTVGLSLWFLVPFIPWILMYPVVRAMGYFAPRRIGPADIAFRKDLAEFEQQAREDPKRDASP